MKRAKFWSLAIAGFYNPDNNVERWTEMLAFLEEHIGASAVGE